jgi:hypothetical protein
MKSIKNNRPSKKSPFTQGYFPLNEAKKYKGSGPIIYRSSWEKKFCLYCERTPAILWWSSESLCIKYFNPLDNKYHSYFPDFIIGTDTGKTWIIEIKPKSQFKKPNLPKRKTKKAMASYKWAYEAWVTNVAKKEAATKLAKTMKDCEFRVITEDFFKMSNK